MSFWASFIIRVMPALQNELGSVPPSLISHRVLLIEGLVLTHLKCLVRFTSETIWSCTFLH